MNLRLDDGPGPDHRVARVALDPVIAEHKQRKDVPL
eukprot:COSAG03_NODE_23837_length_276_cov_1.751412_1_plen_35_part_10